MSLYAVETDAPCRRCGERHGVVTQMCLPMLFTDYGSARWVSRAVEGSVVRETDQPPANSPYVLDVTKDGKHNPAYPVSGRLG